MSRGRGGPSKEHYNKYPPPHLQARENYYRPGPSSFYPRAGPQQVPHPSEFYSSARTGVPLLSPPPSLSSSAPPLRGGYSPAYHKPNISHHQNNHYHSPCPAPDSFQHQLQFLRGEREEAPQFRANLRGGGSVPQRPPSSSYQPQPGYSRYPNPSSSSSSSSSGGRGPYCQDHNLTYQSRARGSRHTNQNQLQGKSRNQYSNRQWSSHIDFMSEGFQSLSLHRDEHRGGESFNRPSPVGSSAKRSFSEVPITLTLDIQEQVHRALAALRPSESIPAKSLAKKLRLPKKVVNKALYSLERSLKASKQGLHPPEWRLCRGEDQRSILQRPPPPPCVNSEHPENPQVNLQIKVETEEVCIEAIEDGTEYSSSYCSSSESSDSEETQTPATAEHQGRQRPSNTSSPVQELKSPTMTDHKQRVLQFLLETGEATALVIAKNLSLRTAKQINPTLYALEKQGDVNKNNSANPLIWELSNHRRERMQRSLKAAKATSTERIKMEEGTSRDEMETESTLLPSPELLSPEPNQWSEQDSHRTPEQSHSKKPSSITSRQDGTNEGQWANDDIPEFLNAIRRETDASRQTGERTSPMGTVAVSLAAPPPQNLKAKLQEVRLKNPVSGLMEYAQYLGQTCEFQLLDQSGPSHDPRFRMQVMLNGRLFPVAEASSKKVAKKDAAAATLRILTGEMQGGASTGDEGNTVIMDQVADLSPDTSGTGGLFGPGAVEVIGMVESPRQPLSRSLPGGKNPVSLLMEYSQRSGNPIEFIVTGQAGPPHDPRFKYRVKVGENLFAEASAPSKKAARQLAAEEAVKELMAEGRLQLNKPQLPLGSSSDSDGGGSGTTCPSLPPLTADELRAAHEAGVGDLINHLNNNAVSGLLEYARARGFAAEIRLVGQSGPPHEPKFTYQAKLGGRWFPPVCASNKKQGKQEAADAALRVLIGEAEKAARTGELVPAELPVSGSTLHDQIAMLSHQRFNALTTRIQHSLLGRKILATIVMRRGEGLGTVVSLGTGNRCVKGEELSLKGETVNDCHAEIISRRGFVRFLYSELLRHYDGEDESIFEPSENNRLRIKPDITFHLYISTAPCGDGALFDKSCSESGDEVDGHQPLFENAKQGKLRTKVENGEGTIPVESSAIVPTWDGIQHGERLRTMSCSDKILRWNVLGLQGALLTHFVDPIYLKSITLGYLYSHGHLTRAVCCRLARDGEVFSKGLSAPFTLNHPEVGRVSVYDSTRHTGKTKESSVNWSFPDHHSVEVLDGTKGKLDGNKMGVSRVSKSHLFCLFHTLCQRCGRNDLLTLHSYAQAKKSAESFQQAKLNFFQALSVHGYGAWIGKPLEEKSFESGEGTVRNGASVPLGFSYSSRNGGAIDIKPETV
ncbi:double-stranded RNA-specific adenosine deaminase [Genypterus blacodes]|uniref:double-stranded RNA-specific adenosine deaminase n=1 Tax=Genypterus blacodes TaxID=154954 RepID=UPI003F760BEA